SLELLTDELMEGNFVPHTSCRNRCYEPYDGDVPGCRCDANCEETNSCCFDFNDTCTLPSKKRRQWECTRLRCGEKRLEKSNCHCSDDCLSAGDCCTNYKHVCHGERQWVEDECEDLSAPACPASFKRQPLLLVSLDGLRAEYLQKWSRVIPVLDRLKTCGTSTPYMQAAFPSKTFPNHYTIVTGLYPESNGLIDNVMYDPVFDASFSLSSPEKDNPDWYLGQPVSLLFKVPFEERVFTVLKWLQLPDNERLESRFYPAVDLLSLSPDFLQLVQSIQGVDKIVGQLMNGLKQIGLHRCVNIIILADHGMEETSCQRKEVMQDLVGDINKYWVTEGPFGRIRARNKDTVIDPPGLVANMTCKKPDQKIKPYLKADLPKRLHFANSRRIEDVNVLVDLKWLFERSPGSLTFCAGGTHGYDNDAASMHAMFLSYGPKFHYKTEIEPFSNIELYNLMCDLLEISPTDNNGTHGSMNHLLRVPFHEPTFPPEQSSPDNCPLESLNPPAVSLGCSCPDKLNKSLVTQQAHRQIRTEVINHQMLVLTQKQHLLFGRPRVLQPDQAYCVLHQEGYITGYSHTALMPLWSSFTIDQPVSVYRKSCMYQVSRLDRPVPSSKTPTCDQYESAGNLTHAFLYPPNLNSTADEQFDALLLSNVVPMYPEFKKIWDYFHRSLLKKYASIYNGVNVVTGPVFDYNYDGRYDSPEQIQQFVSGTNISIPTHYFVVLTSCKDSVLPASACTGELQTVCFLLPHRASNMESCKSSQPEAQWVEDHMWFHQSRVRDVEWVTGLDFYQDSSRPIPELLKMKTRPTAAIQRQQ
uniref:Venom phosphodiesterase 1-like n=1 Tax=Sparus aurata TaxID=8175 RepID=A0A671VE76_SPAAU